MSQLTQKVKAKYPQYANVPDDQLEQKVLTKYPQYKPLASKSVGGFIGNVGSSGVKAVKDIGSSILNIANPNMEKNTVANLGKLAVGTAQLAIPGEQGLENRPRAVGDFYKQRYGGLSNIGNTLYNDPVGAALDASAVFTGVGGLAKGAASTATRGATSVSLASNAAKLGRAGSTLSKVGATLDPIQAVGRGVSRVTRGLPSKAGGALASESENILTRGMGNPQMLKKAKGVSPVSMNELFAKYNTYDRSPESFQAGATTANKQARSLLEAAPTSVDTSRIVKLFDDEIAKLAQQAKTSTKQRLAMEELINRKQMFLEGIQTPDIATPLMNDAASVYDIKSSFQGDVPPSSFGMPTQEVGKNLGTTRAYKTLLSGIEEQAPGIKNLGREQSALLKLKDIALNQENRASTRQNMNFSKLGGASVGGLVSGIPGAIAGYALEQVANSPQFLAGSSKAMQLGSKALGAKLPMSDLLKRSTGVGYNTARMDRMLNPSSNNTSNEQISQTKQRKVSVNAYPSSITGMEVKKTAPSITNEIKYKKPKNIFKNKSAFGKKVRVGS